MGLQLWLRHGECILPVDCGAGDAVLDVKRAAESILGIPADRQRISHGGALLADPTELLCDAGISSETVLEVESGFCVLVATELWGEQANVRLQFAARPLPHELLAAIEGHYGPLHSAARPIQGAAEPYRVAKLQLLDPGAAEWAELCSLDQLAEGSQLYATPQAPEHDAPGPIPSPVRLAALPGPLLSVLAPCPPAPDEDSLVTATSGSSSPRTESPMSDAASNDGEAADGGAACGGGLLTLDLAAGVRGAKHNLRLRAAAGMSPAALLPLAEALFRRHAAVSDDDFSVEAMQVYDDGAQQWVPLTAAEQISDGCQLYCHAAPRPAAGAPRGLPEAPQGMVALPGGGDQTATVLSFFVAAELHGHLWNHELTFREQPDAAGLCTAADALYDPLCRALRRQGSPDVPFSTKALAACSGSAGLVELGGAELPPPGSQLFCLRDGHSAPSRIGPLPEPRATLTWTPSVARPSRLAVPSGAPVPTWAERLGATFAAAARGAECVSAASLHDALRAAEMEPTAVAVGELQVMLSRCGGGGPDAWRLLCSAYPNLAEGIYWRLCADAVVEL
eukprot:TRINITY_DN15696_c0_g1_i1.p2 TRINITY_DN15696_c0_g1~~TRINITY_DN15696_c0_g1_i1.p2  ORF type:complete len:589 (+),score=183.12 TRINITY_DN15696_c0_g1_i1:70-1767(+)